MIETQRTVCDWVEATFGPAGTNLSCVVRANEEKAELLFDVTTDFLDEAAREAADVLIVLYRLADRFGIDLRGRMDRSRTDGSDDSPLDHVVDVDVLMAGLMAKLALDDDNPTAVEDIVRIAVLLRSLVVLLGHDLHDEVDRKMQVNRGRRWRLTGTGQGYHVSEGGDGS